MNLYEIDAALMAAYEDAVDMETGEILDNEAYAAIDGLEMALAEKTENILLWIKNLSAEAEALKAEKMSFDARQKRAERKAESLKRYVSKALEGKKFKTDRVEASWRKSESAEFEGNVMSLPENCIRVKEPEVNKAELKKLLKAGQKIEGAWLVEKQNLQIK